MTDRGNFGVETNTEQVVEGVDLSGAVAIVTGASSGLGAETARILAKIGADVTLTARDLAKAEAVAASIRGETGSDSIDVMELELQRPESVRRFAEKWLAAHGRLNLLVNNAGVMACPLARTDEGWEMQFATNHLGHFLLTGLLAPALVVGAPSRVVNLSSAGHRFAPVDLEDPHFEQREYDKWASYGQAKTANVLHAVELDRRLRKRGVRAFAIHPGAIMTELGRHLDRDDIATLQSRAPGGGLVFKPVEIGAATQVYAATAPELAGQGGLYLEDCRVSGMRHGDDATHGYMPWAVDLDAAERLWALSEMTLGEKFRI